MFYNKLKEIETIFGTIDSDLIDSMIIETRKFLMREDSVVLLQKTIKGIKIQYIANLLTTKKYLKKRKNEKRK